MANPYPAAFIDQNNEGRLVGELNFTDPANQPGGFVPDPITTTVNIALPNGGPDSLLATAVDMPNAKIEVGIGSDGGSAILVESDLAGATVLALVDNGTTNGRVKWQTTGSYLQPRSTSADSDQFIEVVDKNGDDALVYQADGSVIFGRKAAIPDGNLAAGQFGFWLDDTNGAAKLMVKAKSANGTVVTGEVALT